MFVAVALTLALLVPLGGWLAFVVLRVETPNGTLIVEIEKDADVEALIKKGKLILIGPDGKVRYELAPSEGNKKIDAGSYKIRVKGVDGLVLDTEEFEMKKGGERKVRVTLKPKEEVVKKDPPSLDPDRKAAEYVLSIGGVVRVNDEIEELRVVGNLPPGAFRLTWFSLRDNKRVSDAGLANFKDCKNLTYLDVWGTQVGDAGLAHFKDCKNLTELILRGTQVTDLGLAHFRDCKNLKELWLHRTQVSDAGLVHFKDCKNLTLFDLSFTQVSNAGVANFKDCENLTSLDLGGTQVSDAGLVHFKECKKLKGLGLRGTHVGDAGLAYFKGCKNLTELGLDATQVSDAGLANFKDCKNLTRLGLDSTQVSDAGLAYFKDYKILTSIDLGRTKVSDKGLAHLKDCKSLTYLGLHKMKVTADGIEELKRALPNCRINWDGGPKPKVSLDPNRKAAECVLSIGGVVRVNDEVDDIKAATDLPREAFRLTYVDLGRNPKLRNTGLVAFNGCKNLTSLTCMKPSGKTRV